MNCAGCRPRSIACRRAAAKQCCCAASRGSRGREIAARMGISGGHSEGVPLRKRLRPCRHAVRRDRYRAEARRERATNVPPASVARADAASRLMDRQLSEDCNEGDDAQLEEWLEGSPAHRVAYWRLEAAWERTDRLAAPSPPHARCAGPSPCVRQRFFLARIAAAVAVAAALGAGAALYVSEPDAKTYATEIGGRETITLRGRLADRTQHRHGRCASRISKGERKVWLDRGEAFFQIQPRCQATLCGDRKRSSHHRSRHEIHRSPRAAGLECGRDRRPRAI